MCFSRHCYTIYSLSSLAQLESGCVYACSYEAQLEEEEAKEQEGRTYSDVDTVVNATAKLIGEHGAPEYCQGKNFRIFLKSKQKDGEYKDLAKVHLARQVGSWYYVTSYNAGRILCLSEAGGSPCHHCLGYIIMTY